MKLAPGQLRLKKEPSVLVLVEPSALSQPRATYNGDPTIEAPGAAAGGGDPTQAAGAGVSVGAVDCTGTQVVRLPGVDSSALEACAAIRAPAVAKGSAVRLLDQPGSGGGGLGGGIASGGGGPGGGACSCCTELQDAGPSTTNTTVAAHPTGLFEGPLKREAIVPLALRGPHAGCMPAAVPAATPSAALVLAAVEAPQVARSEYAALGDVAGTG